MTRKKLPKKGYTGIKELGNTAKLGDMLKAKGADEVRKNLKQRGSQSQGNGNEILGPRAGVKRRKVTFSSNKSKTKRTSKNSQERRISERQKQKNLEAEYKNQNGPVERVYHDMTNKLDPLSREVAYAFRYNQYTYKPTKTWTAKEPEKDPVEELHQKLRNGHLNSPPSMAEEEHDTASVQILKNYVERSHTGFYPIDKNNLTSAVIGFDFGTSSTKIVVQLPHVMGGVSAALPVPECFRADNHPHLWATCIYFSQKTRAFSLERQQGFEKITGIKTQLMGLDFLDLTDRQANGLSPEILATAFVALILRVTVGWAVGDTFKETTSEGLRWSVNMGVPAVTLDNEKQKKLFSAVLSASWLLASSRDPVTIETITNYHARSVKMGTPSELSSFKDAGLTLIPEIVAASVGFIKSNLASEGLYVMVDVGASTLDASAFDLSRDEHGIWDYKIYTADVRLFGVFATKWIEKIKVKDTDLLDACSVMLRRVVWRSRIKESTRSVAWSTKLPVLICGGGRDMELYRKAISSINDLLRKNPEASGIEPMTVPLPVNLTVDVSENSFHRLAVAWGLSFEEFEFGEIFTPSYIDDFEYQDHNSSWEDRFIDKDQV